MWTRKELKDNAKFLLSANYWPAVVMGLILWLAGGAGAGINIRFTFGIDPDSGKLGLSRGIPSDMSSLLSAFVPMIFGMTLFGIIIGILIHIFVRNPLTIGLYRFFVDCRKGKPSYSCITYGFQKNYTGMVKTMFLRDLFTFLWSLLFVVPGIVKAYEYAMIPYLLAENPGIDSATAFAVSRQMMEGNKWAAFVLDLSFIGWAFAASFTCGIAGIFYVIPYRELTIAELYHRLKANHYAAYA